MREETHVKSRALAPRPSRVLPVLAVLAAAGAAVLITSTGAVAQGSCESFARAAAAVTPAAQSNPCSAFGVGTVSLLSIRQGDASQIRVTSSDPSAALEITVNEDPGITCTYHNRTYVGLSADQYNLIVNGGSTANEPTLTITLGTAVPGGLGGAQFAIFGDRAQVCFGSPKPFTPRTGSSLTTTNDPGIGVQYVGLLPDCGLFRRGVVQPCITARSAAQIPVGSTPTGVVNITFTVPPGFDPRMHS